MNAPYDRKRVPLGFTLIELMVVTAIIAVLTALLFAVSSTMTRKGRQMKEFHAARQIIAAYLAYPADHHGELMRGYDKNVQEVALVDGTTISGEMCCRYPWRLAPYLGEQVEEVFRVNIDRKKTDRRAIDSFDYQYWVSLNPALGQNAYCVGGYDDGSESGDFQSDVVRRLGQALEPGNLIVFASARRKESAADKEIQGNFIVKPPKLWRTKWSVPFNPDKPASSFGNVDLRWDEQAICAFLDGSVRLLGEKELLDMRNWSNTARQINDREFAVPR